MKGRVLAAGIAVVLTAAVVPSADAAVSIGQLGTPFPTSCGGDRSWAQPTVTSGPSYVSPANGTITSWSSNAGPSDTRLKVWHQVGGNLLTSVGRSELRAFPAGGVVVSYPASVPISAGDSIGLYTSDTANCLFQVPGETYLDRDGDVLENGVSALFGPQNNFRVTVTASIEPSNGIAIGRVTKQKGKGTATIAVTVPNPGKLVASGGGAAGEATATAAGEVTLKVKAKGKKRRKLNGSGKVTVNPTIAFTPTGGAASATTTKLKLVKN